jgi:hypothetical protein
MEVIRQDPAVAEPFQTLATLYDTLGKISIKVVLIRLGIYLLVAKARGGGSPNFFIHTL